MAWEDLARAVLLRAAYDALCTSKCKRHKSPSQKDKREATRFLQGKKPFRETLETWCLICGVNPACVMKIMNDENLLKKDLTFTKLNAIIASVDETERSQNDRNPTKRNYRK